MKYKPLSDYYLAYTDNNGEKHFRFCIDQNDVQYWIDKFKERGYKTYTVFKELKENEVPPRVPDLPY